MRPKHHTTILLAGVAAACLAGSLAATPVSAQVNVSYGLLGPVLPDPAYQNPDGSFPSYTDFSMQLWGMPCGIECTREAAVRWGLVPPPVPYPYRARHWRHRRHY